MLVLNSTVNNNTDKPVGELARALLNFKATIELQQYRLFAIFTWA